MDMTVRYYDRYANKIVELSIPADVLTVEIPEQPNYNGQPDWHLPALKINVNTDAVLICHEDDKLIQMHDYTDMLAEASGDENKSLFHEAVNGLKEYYPELNDPQLVEAIKSRVAIPDTGNKQNDYEAVRNAVENQLNSYIMDNRFLGN